VAAAVLHAQQLGDALVELVVADAGDVEAERVERLDARLVLEQAGEERRPADEVAGGDGQRVAVALAQVAQMRRQVLDAAGRDRGAGAGHEGAVRARRRLQVTVVVVERQDLEVDRRLRLRRRTRGTSLGHGDEGSRDGERPDQPASTQGGSRCHGRRLPIRTGLGRECPAVFPTRCRRFSARSGRPRAQSGGRRRPATTS
jgi:hypothetical protein